MLRLLVGSTIKALIATESSFNPDAQTKVKNPLRKANGLLQITGETRHILQDVKGELKDHTESQLLDPNFNIAAGIRWLFRKHEIAVGRDSNASWIETIALYKSYKKDDPKLNNLKKYYKTLSDDPKK